MTKSRMRSYLVLVVACVLQFDRLVETCSANLDNSFWLTHGQDLRNESEHYSIRAESQEQCGDIVISNKFKRQPVSIKTRIGLPEIKGSKNSKDEEFVAAGESVMQFDLDLINRESLSVNEILRRGLIALVQSSAYSDRFSHRYETFEEMTQATGPKVDNKKCIVQLEDMVDRVRRLAKEGFRSKDFTMYYVLDMWGRQAPGHLRGDFFMEGSYDECIKARIRWTDTGNRYCVAKYKFDDWDPIDFHDVITISTGICIPDTCDSTKYKNKYQLIEEVMKYQFRGAEADQIKMVDLYCLPDANSPLRSIWRSPRSVITLICLSLWISWLIYATRKHSQMVQRAKEKEEHSTEKAESVAESMVERGRLNLYRMFSITNNFRSLFDTSKSASLTETAAQKESEQEANKDSESGQSTELDIRPIEGIKVIAMCYIIMGHVLMCLPTSMRNGRELAEQGINSIAFLTANLVPAFAVNSFFAITGILTSFLLFKQNKQHRVITSPSKWAAFILFRYLRIMPMYALAVLYCKTLAKYTGSGPLWDYGTSALSQRRSCEHENWTWTLTFTSNFVSPMEHCIPGGWYLSNDFQFFLVTPIYVALLHWRPLLGRLLLCTSIVAGYLAGFFSIYNSDVPDLRPIANFSPSGFKTYVSHLSFNYTHPQYRIPAYLIGLLVGYEMYCLEKERAKFRKLPESERQGKEVPSWPPVLRKHGAQMITGIIIVSVSSPVLGLISQFNKPMARFMVALVTPTYHVGFAFVISVFIMLNSTGDANKRITRLLSAKFWKPLARLSLCAVLVNVEAINYIIQSSTRGHRVTNSSLIMLNLYSILATYISATIVCCLFEAPIRSALNLLITRVLKKASSKESKSD